MCEVSDDAVTLVYVRYFPGNTCALNIRLYLFRISEVERGIIAAWTQKTSNRCDEWTIAP